MINLKERYELWVWEDDGTKGRKIFQSPFKFICKLYANYLYHKYKQKYWPHKLPKLKWRTYSFMKEINTGWLMCTKYSYMVIYYSGELVKEK